MASPCAAGRTSIVGSGWRLYSSSSMSVSWATWWRRSRCRCPTRDVSPYAVRHLECRREFLLAVFAYLVIPNYLYVSMCRALVMSQDWHFDRLLVLNNWNRESPRKRTTFEKEDSPCRSTSRTFVARPLPLLKTFSRHWFLPAVMRFADMSARLLS